MLVIFLSTKGKTICLNLPALQVTASYKAVHISTPVTSHLCSVPTVEAPGDAMSECSGGIQGGGPASRHKTTRKNHNQIRFRRSA